MLRASESFTSFKFHGGFRRVKLYINFEELSRAFVWKMQKALQLVQFEKKLIVNPTVNGLQLGF